MNTVHVVKKELVTGVEHRLLAKVLSKLTGMESLEFNDKVSETVIKELELFPANKPIPQFNEVGIILNKLRASLEERAEKFIMSGNVIVPALENEEPKDAMIRSMYAYESENEDNDDTDDPDGDFETDEKESVSEKTEVKETGIALMVANLIKEVVSADASDVNSIADRIVQITKSETDSSKESELDDENTFATIDKEPENDDDDEDNPFDGGDKEPEDKNGDNPFDDGDKEPESKDDGKEPKKVKEPEANPFEDNKNEPDDKKNKKSSGNETVKNISNLTLPTFGLESVNGIKQINPFFGLENKTFSYFAKAYADVVYGDTMKNVYDKFGLESEKFTNVKKDYVTLTRSIHSAAIATTLLSSLVGTEVNISKLKSPKAFF